MKIAILSILTLIVVFGCRHQEQKQIPLNSLAGMDWYQRVLETEELKEIGTNEHLPEYFIHYLQAIDSNFSIAIEDELWQVGCSPPLVIDSTYKDKKTGKTVEIIQFKDDAPSRKLVYFGQNKKMAALVYLSGGIGVMQHLILFKIENDKIVDYWHGGIQDDIDSQKDLLDRITQRKYSDNKYI